MRIVLSVTSPPPSKREKSLENDFLNLLAGDFLQIRKIPSPEKEGKPFRHLIHIPVVDFQCHEVWKGDATVELGKSGYYPNLYRMNPTEIVGGYYARAEWIVPYSKILGEF